MWFSLCYTPIYNEYASSQCPNCSVWTHEAQPSESTIDQFTVVCLVTWPLDGSEARVDLVLIHTSLLLLCKTSRSDGNEVHLHDKSREVCIKTRSTLASLPSTGQVAEQTTVKWSISKITKEIFVKIC